MFLPIAITLLILKHCWVKHKWDIVRRKDGFTRILLGFLDDPLWLIWRQSCANTLCKTVRAHSIKAASRLTDIDDTES